MSAGYVAKRGKEAERDAVLERIRDAEGMTVAQLDDLRVHGFTAAALRWHLLILGDRGLVEWSTVDGKRVVSAVKR